MTTPIHFDGFNYDLLSANGGGLWNSVSGSPSIVTDGGVKALHLNPSASNQYVNKSGLSGTVLVFSFQVKFPSNLPAADCRFFGVYPATGGSDLYVGFQQSTSKISLYFNGGTVQVSSSAISAGNDYRIDGRVNVAANPWTCDWQFEGTAQTQATRAVAASTISSYGIGQDASQTYDAYIKNDFISATSGDYPIGSVAIGVYRPSSDGTHNNGANLLEDAAGSQINGTTVYAYAQINKNPWTTETTVRIQQDGADATKYVEALFEDTTETQILGVRAILQYQSATATSNAAGCGIIDEDSAFQEIWGNPTTRQDYSESSAFYKSKILPAPSGGWDTAAVNALKVRCGYASDATPDPWWLNVIIEVAYVAGPAPTTVNLSAGAVTAGGQALTVVEGAVTKNLAAGGIAATGPQMTVSAPFPPVSINLVNGGIASQGLAMTVVEGAVSKLLATGLITAGGQALTVVEGAVSKLLAAGEVAAQGLAMTVNAPAPGVNVSLASGGIASQGLAMTVIKGAVTKALLNGALTAGGQAITVSLSGAPVTVMLSAGGIAAGGQILTVIEGARILELLYAAITAGGQGITVSAPAPEININLANGALTAGGQGLGITPGARALELLYGAITAEGQTITISAVPLITAILALTLGNRSLALELAERELDWTVVERELALELAERGLDLSIIARPTSLTMEDR